MSVALIRRIQELFRNLYNLEPGPDVADFLIAPEILAEFPSLDTSSREALLVREAQGELELAIYIHPSLLADAADPLAFALDSYCCVAEGVSHFLYICSNAARARPVTQLELELQAEVDKYVLCARDGRWPQSEARGRSLHSALFEGFTLDGRDQDRYRDASRLAARYCQHLLGKFGDDFWSRPFLEHVRSFYLLDQENKLRLISGLRLP